MSSWSYYNKVSGIEVEIKIYTLRILLFEDTILHRVIIFLIKASI